MSKATATFCLLLGLWLAALTGCGGEADLTPKPLPAGKPERPLKSEHKEAYRKFLLDRSNARFPNLDADGLREAFRGKIKDYTSMVAHLGKPDEIRIIDRETGSDKDIREGISYLRAAVYHNLIFHGSVVESYYFITGETNKTTNPLMPLEESKVGFGYIVPAVYYVAE